MNMTRDEILRKLEENRETIRGFGVRRLGVFGSYARDEVRGASAGRGGSRTALAAFFESPTIDDVFMEGSNTLRWWTRLQRIRTLAKTDFQVALLD
jgi:hypothetical protein